MNRSYKIGWHCFRALFRFYFRWRVCNPERVPESGPVILACNHASFLDPPLVGAVSPWPRPFSAPGRWFRWTATAGRAGE